jgi:hypothetical protein
MWRALKRVGEEEEGGVRVEQGVVVPRLSLFCSISRKMK